MTGFERRSLAIFSPDNSTREARRSLGRHGIIFDMIILGIDPGSRKAGYALIECEGRKFKYIDSGTLMLEKEGEFFARLKKAYEESLELVSKYHPDEIALESLIYVKSPTALIKLAQTRGAMLSAFLQTHQNKIYEYPPNSVKMSVSGHGHADKESMQKTLQMIFGKNTEFKTFDESDALAIAVCHGLNRGTKMKTKVEKK